MRGLCDNYGMAVTLTAKQDGFAQAVADGDLADNECYRAFYNCSRMSPEAVSVEASRLMRVPKVALRIDALRAAVTTEIVKSRAWDQSRFIDEAETNLDLARAANQIAPANGALTLIGKVTGIITEDKGSVDTALDVIIKVAAALSEASLRAQAGPAIEGVYEVIDD